MRLFHCSDLHLGQCLYGGMGPDGIELRLREQGHDVWHNALCGAAIEASADLFLFTGDAVRDPNPSSTVNVFLQRGLCRLQRAQIPVVMVVGNHDWDGSGRASALEVFEDEGVLVCREPGVHLIHDACGDPMCLIVAVPYFRDQWLAARHPEKSKAALAEEATDLAGQLVTALLAEAIELNSHIEEPLPIIGAVHHSIEGSTLSNGYETAGPGDLRIPLRALDRPEFAYVACGHIHKRQQLAERVWYAGSPLALDFGEERDAKGYILVKALRGDGSPPIVTPLNVESRRFLTLDLDFTLPDSWQTHVRRACNQAPVEGAIVRVRYTCTRAQKPGIDHNFIAEAVTAAGAWHLHSITPSITDAGTAIRVEGLSSTAIDPLSAATHYINARPDYQPHREGLLAKLTTLLEEDNATRAA